MILLQEAIGAAIFSISLFAVMMLAGVPLLSLIFFRRFKRQQENLNRRKASGGSVILMLLASLIFAVIIMPVLSFIVISLLSAVIGPLG